MIEIRNNERLQRWLLESGHLGRLSNRPRFLFDSEEFEREVAGVREQYPQFREEEAQARAALRLLGKEEARSRLVVLPTRSRWTPRERVILLLAAGLLALAILLLGASRAHGQALSAESSAVAGRATGGYRSLWLRPEPSAQGGQPGGIIIQLANQGTVLATRPAGLLQFNCSTNLTCSFSGTVFTLTASGGSGSGCIPPGTTANALLYDAGSGACGDVSKLTWNSGTSSLSLLSGGIFDPTAGTMKVPGTSGQLLFNNSGALGAEDPIVSGPDARGAAQSKNPVAGLGGIDYTTNCSSGPCVQEAKVDSSGNLYTTLTGTLPAFAATPTVNAAESGAWSVSLTGSWPYSGTLGNVGLNSGSNTIGAVTQASGPWTINLTQLAGTNLGAPSNYGTSPGAVAVPGVNAFVTNTPSVAQSGTWTVQPGNTANTTPWLVTVNQGGNSATVTASNALKVDGSAVTQPVSGTVTANQGGSNWSINVAQVGGNAASTVANGTLEVGVADASGNGITSNSTTYSSKHGLDVNLLGALGTAFTTAGAVNIQGVGGGTAVPVSGTFWQTTQPVSCTAANCAINLGQWGGTTVNAGNGTSGAGDPRVNIASDNTAIANWGQGATGSVVPSGAQYHAGAGSGNLTGYLNCDNTAVYDASTNGATQLVALSSGKKVYVCGFQFSTSQTTAVNVDLVYGTGTNCATGTTKMTPAYPLQALSSSGPTGLVLMTPGFVGLATAASNALCINTNAAVSVQAIVFYTQF